MCNAFVPKIYNRLCSLKKRCYVRFDLFVGKKVFRASHQVVELTIGDSRWFAIREIHHRGNIKSNLVLP